MKRLDAIAWVRDRVEPPPPIFTDYDIEVLLRMQPRSSLEEVLMGA